MSPASALRAARAAGIDLRIDGSDLVLEAPAPPPPDVLNLLARHKAAIVVILRLGAGDEGWSEADWKAFYDEQAGIAEFDAGLPRPEAEGSCPEEWCN